MKIGILGPIYISVCIDSKGSFDLLTVDKGVAEITYSGPYIELAKQLSSKHDVSFITSLDTRSSIFILKYLKSYGIDTSNITYGPSGTAFQICFNDGFKVESGYSLDSVHILDRLEADPQFDVLVVSDLIPEVIDTCVKHNIRVIWYADQYLIDSADYEDDADLLAKVEIVSTDVVDIEEVLS